MMNLKMKDVTVGTLYMDTRKNMKCFITGKNSKFKTLEIQYENLDIKNVSIATVNKYFEAVEERPANAVEDVPAVNEENNVNDVENAVEAVESVTEAPKKERKPRQKKETSEGVKNLIQFVKTEWEKIGYIRYPNKENAVFCALCANETGRQVVKLMWTTRKISMFVRVPAAVDFAEESQKINYAMPYQCIFKTDNVYNRGQIKNLLEMVADADSVRITKKMKKENAKKTEETAA